MNPTADTPPRILIATTNPGKLREVRQILGDLPVDLVDLSAFPGLAEPVEDGRTFDENAVLKARHYARLTGLLSLADDSGLEVDALGGDPGVRSARYALDDGGQPCGTSEPYSTGEPCGSGFQPVDSQCGTGFQPVDRAARDAANNRKLLEALRDVPLPRRTARFRCAAALADRRGVIAVVSGAVEGVILAAPRGESGFGYDPLFFVPEAGLTTAEMTPTQKNAISHRGRAMRAIAPMIEAIVTRRP